MTSTRFVTVVESDSFLSPLTHSVVLTQGAPGQLRDVLDMDDEEEYDEILVSHE